VSPQFVMPSLGESVEEGVITRWLKGVGDIVEADEPLLEVATDKVDTEIPAPYAGIIREFLAEENSTVAVGEPLAVIDAADGTHADTTPHAEPSPEPALPQPAPAEPAPATPEPDAVPGPTADTTPPTSIETAKHAAAPPEPTQIQAPAPTVAASVKGTPEKLRGCPRSRGT
jgi:pyruvate dehydrogenase E2 component (dihydrolipoamide acetyltransferase)